MLSFSTPRLTTKLPTLGVLGVLGTVGGREDSVDEEATVDAILDVDDTSTPAILATTAPEFNNEKDLVSRGEVPTGPSLTLCPSVSESAKDQGDSG